MTLQEVKQFLRDNAEKDAEVKAYLAELSKVSPDAEEQIIRNFKNSQEFKSEQDRLVTKAINTYNEKTVPTLIEKSVKDKETELENKYNPPKNPAEENLRKEVEELKRQNQERQNKIIRDSINLAKQKALSEMGLPIELSDAIYVRMDGLTEKDIEDKEKLKSLIFPSIEPIVKFSEAVKTAKANEMLSNSATHPLNSDSPVAGQLTLDQYKSLPHDERMKAQKEGRVNQLLNRK
jgi:hypothetical protein